MLTPEEEKKKREIFEAMSPRRQQKILKKGYDNWDPFQKPKDPAEMIKKEHDEKRRALNLFQRYLVEKKENSENDEYLRGVREMSEGLVEGKDRYRGMYDFACWYAKKGKE
jgi:hypothetical protein